ncbi:MAG: DUF5661 family protein [Candidatus Hermodarchaeia archaeon]|jgi:hypothetical protein
MMITWQTFLENKAIQQIAQKAGIDISEFDPKELRKGQKVEKEHDGEQGKDLDVVKSDADLLKIVVAHLREDPKYYTKLHKANL